MRSLHANWFYFAVVTSGLAGLWGLGLALLKRPATRPFHWAAGTAVAAMLLQVGFGLVLYAQDVRPGNDFHIFYGFVILFTFTFAYIYRAQIARRPALAWGLLLLFVMGLGLRAWSNVN